MNRRSFLRGVVAAPAVILTPGLLMPVRKLYGVGPVAAAMPDVLTIEKLRSAMARMMDNVVSPPLLIDGSYWAYMVPGEPVRWHSTQELWLR